MAREGEARAGPTLRAIAVSLIESGEPLPESLRGWAVEAINSGATKQRTTPGPKPAKHADRNGLIFTAAQEICRTYGFKMTRNRESMSRDTACSIVAKALEQVGLAMSEVNVEKIVEKRTKN